MGSRTASKRCHWYVGRNVAPRRFGPAPRSPLPPATGVPGAKVQGTPQRLSRLNVFAPLRDSQRAGVAGLLSDPLGHFAVERPDRVEGEVAAMDRTVGIPGLLQPVRVLAEFDAVGGHALEASVKNLFGEHRGC